MERVECRKEKISSSSRYNYRSCYRRASYWLVVIATCGSLVGCQHLKTMGATSGVVAATGLLTGGAVLPTAIAGGVTAGTVSAITAKPQTQAAEITADTVVHHAPDNFFTLLGKLIKMGGIATILIVLVPMIFSWLMPGPIQFKGRKKK